jgi:3'-phosphoadenosine 5'-phosphosulfate (PAPS) 3'-phosphatase
MNEKHADLLIQWVREAGKRSLDLRNKGLDVQTKADESVVTNADFELNDFFEEKLTKLFPDTQFIGEESEHNTPDKSSDTIWYVDPIDGTSNYVHNSDYYFILIGRCTNGIPDFGLCYQPVFDRFWITKDDAVWDYNFPNNDFRKVNPLPSWQKRNNNAISLKYFNSDQREIVTSKWGLSRAQYFHTWPGALALPNLHSAGYLSFRPTHFWDTCAIIAIMTTLGAEVQLFDKYGDEMTCEMANKSHALAYYLPDTPDDLKSWFREQLR